MSSKLQFRFLPAKQSCTVDLATAAQLLQEVHQEVASSACTLQVDGVKNPKVQSVYLADMPVHKAAFADNGTKVGTTATSLLNASLLFNAANHLQTRRAQIAVKSIELSQ